MGLSYQDLLCFPSITISKSFVFKSDVDISVQLSICLRGTCSSVGIDTATIEVEMIWAVVEDTVVSSTICYVLLVLVPVLPQIVSLHLIKLLSILLSIAFNHKGAARIILAIHRILCDLCLCLFVGEVLQTALYTPHSTPAEAIKCLCFELTIR